MHKCDLLQHGLRVCWSQPSAAKTAESIDMSFELWTHVGPGNHVLGPDSGPSPQKNGQF